MDRFKTRAEVRSTGSLRMIPTTISASQTQSVFSNKVGSSLAKYPHAKRCGPLLFLSGCSARQPDNSVLGVDICPYTGAITTSIALQTEGVIKNMELILQECGGSLKNVVDLTVFLADMADYDEFNKVYNQYFDEKTGPARTTIAASALPGKNLLIEIKGTAILDA